MKKRILSFALAFVFALAPVFCFPFFSGAETLSVSKGYGTDESVYAPAKYDLVVATNLEEPTYQWFVGVGRNVPVEELMTIEDNEKWSGTRTAHLSLITNDGLAYTEGDDGWDDLYFCCLVTDKNGRKLWGPDMNMIVFPHAALLEKLEKEGVGIASSGVRYQSGSSLPLDREEDGVKYYRSYGDSAFLPSVTYSPMSSELRERSDGELVKETFITYGGKTVPFTDPDQGYRPERYGTAVVFRTDLVLYVGEKRMETLDSVTSVVNVKAPDGIGTAPTKTGCAVLAEQYSQARVLKELGKGEIVTLLSEAGGYWRVAAGGYFGYIPKTALDVSDAISSVAVTVAEPAAYQTPASAAVPAEPDRYELDPKLNQKMWYDETSDKYLESGDVFLPGHSYQAVIWVTAKAGKRFPLANGKPDVAGWVNGVPATVSKAHEQDPEEVIQITYTFDHVHDLTKVNRVYPTCTEPGKEYHYRCAGCGWNFEDAGAKVRITEEDWGILPALGHRESEWKSNGTNHYKVCLRRECGETIPGTLGAHSGGTATCVQEAVCEVCGLSYGALAPHTYSSEWNYRTGEGHAHRCTEPLCGEHDAVLPHRPGPAATATAPQVCLDCGYVLEKAHEHRHTLSPVAEQKATCTESGRAAYYVCNGCGEWFSDAAGSSPVKNRDSLVLKPLGHRPADAWTADGASHWHVCLNCGLPVEESREKHSDLSGDGTCDLCGAPVDAATSAPETQPPVTAAPGTDPAGTTPAETTQTGTTPGTNAGGDGALPLPVLLLIVFSAAAVLAGTVVSVVSEIKRRKKR